MMHTSSQRGFTLLIAVILASVALSLGAALLDIALKQVVLASSARQSQNAFYRADTAMECALFHDQVNDSFSYIASGVSTLSCGEDDEIAVTSDVEDEVRISTFEVPCDGGGLAGQVTIRKASDATTDIYASGYNTCDEDNPRRIERALKVSY